MRKLALLLGLGLAFPIAAQPMRIRQGTLGGALEQLSREIGINVAVEDAALWKRRVHGIVTERDAETALRRLLAQVDARPVRIGPTAWRVVRVSRPPTPAVQAAPAPAQPLYDDIVVTGSKRDLRLSQFPGTVEILDGSRFVPEGSRGTDAVVTRLASLSSTYLGAGRNKLFIRGIADSSFTGPTQGTVGEYLGDIRLTYNAPDPDLRLYDIASVEVLEGPQGTLYGAGSLGGIVRIVPNAPKPGMIAGAMSAAVSATRHGSAGGDLDGWINLPLGQRAALRVVGYGVQEGGYIDDILRDRQDINRTRVKGGRATLLLSPGHDWRILLGLVGQDVHGRDSQYAERGLPPLQRASPTAGGFDAEYRLASMVVEKSWDKLRFLSSSAVIGHRLNERYDATVDAAQPRLFEQRNRTTMFTTENRLWRPIEDGFGWVLGASYTRNRTTLDRELGPADNLLATTGVTNRIDELTGFAEASVEHGALTLTSGLRWTHDRLAGSAEDVSLAVLSELMRQGTTGARSEDELLPSAAVSMRLPRGMLAFVRYQEGMRPGGLAIEATQVRRFRKDRVRSVEAGFRFGAPADMLSGALSASFASWSNIQADYIDGAGLPSTSNVGDGRIYSLSGSFRLVPRPGLTFELASTLNESRITDPSAAYVQSLINVAIRGAPPGAPQPAPDPLGRIPNIAKMTARAAVVYETEMSEGQALTFEGWAKYVGRSRLGVGPVLGGEQGQYVDTGVSGRVAFGRFGVTVSLTNLFDAVGNRFALGTPFARDLAQVTPLRPRTLRLGVDRRF